MYIRDKGPGDSFKFDDWLALANKDPDAFEQRRQACIEAFLSNLPSTKQRKLRGLQFKIDMERRRARTPMGACIKLSSMMWDSLLGPHGLMTSLHMVEKPWPGPSSVVLKSAEIISFKKN